MMKSTEAIHEAQQNLQMAGADRANDRFESAMIRASIGGGYARLAAVLQEQEWREWVGRDVAADIAHGK